MTFKPLLAATVENFDALSYPLYATPKIDGVRCLIMPEGPRSRSLKPIQNRFIRDKLSDLPVGLDGEIWIKGAKCFGDTSGPVMARDGEPDFLFYVFDWFDKLGGYMQRVEALAKINGKLNATGFCELLYPIEINNRRQLDAYEAAMLKRGHEGVMLRRADSPYKHGRSTFREGYLLRIKRFVDAEAVVSGFEELQHNDNEAKTDELGHTKRSSSKAGKRAGDTLGNLICVTPEGVEFKIGSGFTAKQRDEIWHGWRKYRGKIVKYKFQEVGGKDRPRIPVFLGFRDEGDL